MEASMKRTRKLPPCGNIDCGVSTGFHDGLTFGSGELDEYGYWEKPCTTCARAYETAHTGYKAWPFEPEDQPK
jgi:hypothetical protein